jgi:hypothetical protein
MTATARVAFAVVSVMTTCALASPAAAQDENALKAAFEGHRVTVRIDMPGTSDGVDVKPESRRGVDLGGYQNNLKRYGIAIHAGESATVTQVKVKKDLIEFHLGGGGFGTFGDDTSTTVNMPHMDKTSREKDLEKLIKDEPDRDRRSRYERELDDLRDRRERENRRIDIEKERAEQVKRERLAENRLRGGSRFNIRYEDRVPAGMRPQDVIAALAEYVDFGGGEPSIAPQPPAPMPGPPPPGGVTGLRKGMTRLDAERMLGVPAESSQHRQGDIAVTTLVFIVGDEKVSADFVEDVLVRYTISSK